VLFRSVTNAIHATERDGAITLNAWYDPSRQRFELRVVDTGTGMKPEVLARATKLFFSTKKSGSGIGLALCKRGIEAAGGELLIESVPGVGTAVSVTVPTNELSPRSV
jgi:signal transduction histidine kinase